MDDYASNALLGLIAGALRHHGYEVDVPSAFGGRTSREVKRALLDGALDALGPAAVLAIGRSIERASSEPAVAVLLRASDPHDLLDRWQRLERYFHSHHRTRVADRAERALTVEHRSLSGPPPSEAEDLFVAGLIAALVERIGANGLWLRVGGHAAIECGRIRDDLSRSDRSASWELGWSGLAAPDPPLPTHDGPATTDARLRSLLETDLGRGWRLADAAVALGASPRSLQRALSNAGTSFRTVLRVARAEAASRMLMAGDIPLVQIGYACGYADQPHFTREFKERFNLPPNGYAAMLD